MATERSEGGSQNVDQAGIQHQAGAAGYRQGCNHAHSTEGATMATKATDSGEPTQSVSDQDASTTQGKQAAGVNPPQATPSSEGGAATANAAGVQRVQIEQAPPEPAVNYEGDPNATNPDRPHVKADYQPFKW